MMLIIDGYFGHKRESSVWGGGSSLNIQYYSTLYTVTQLRIRTNTHRCSNRTDTRPQLLSVVFQLPSPLKHPQVYKSCNNCRHYNIIQSALIVLHACMTQPTHPTMHDAVKDYRGMDGSQKKQIRMSTLAQNSQKKARKMLLWQYNQGVMHVVLVQRTNELMTQRKC